MQNVSIYYKCTDEILVQRVNLMIIKKMIRNSLPSYTNNHSLFCRWPVENFDPV